MSSNNKPYVLIVEDDKYSAEVLGDLLKQTGIQFTAVMDSREVGNVIGSLPHLDAIFLDLDMPSINGYDLLETIHADGRWQGIPVVAYTAYLSEMVNARNAGFHSFLGKPLKSKDFPKQIASILNNQPVWEVR